ncbi:MAG: YhjD/YihY/BrkB family envelope integrity protein [Oryzihumus sp.]
MRVESDRPPHGRRWLEGRVARVDAWRDAGVKQAEAARDRYPAVRFVFTAADHDRVTGGPLLAGALAFRLFLWILPACLVVVGSLGFFSPGATQGFAKHAGLGGFAASTIETATLQSHEARWWLLATGLVALFSTSLTLARTLWVATALAWQLPVVKLRRPPRAVAAVVGLLGSAIGLVLAANWLRSLDYGVGLGTTLLLVVVYTVLGWFLLRLLPRPSQVPVEGLLPGAVLIGVGVQVLHLVTVLYLARRIGSASQLYGALGGAATIMLWAYLVARVLIGATTVNRAWATYRQRVFRSTGAGEGPS